MLIFVYGDRGSYNESEVASVKRWSIPVGSDYQFEADLWKVNDD